MANTKEKNLSKSRDITITRMFNAPRKLVWQAWTDPQHFMKWWGPKGFTSPTCKMDFQVGGKYVYCMLSPEGQKFYSTGVYREITSPEKIVFTDSFADEQGNAVPPTYYGFGADFPAELLVTVTFEEQGDKTKFTLTHSGLPDGELLEMTQVSWNESFDKLTAVLK